MASCKRADYGLTGDGGGGGDDDGRGAEGELSESTYLVVGKKCGRKMNLMDGVAIIVGSIVGSGIFVSPVGVYANAGSAGTALVVWTLSGVFSAMGASCYAELGTLIPESGGDYSYILRAYGPLPGFLAMWTMVVLIQPAVQAVMALTFSNYALQSVYGTCPPSEWAVKLVALSATCLLSRVNSTSTRWSLRLTNSTTFVKVATLLFIIVLGVRNLVSGKTENLEKPFEGDFTFDGLALSFYSGLYTYTGWRSLNDVVGELKNPNKNLPRAIWIGLTLVSAVYILTNLSYIAVIPGDMLISSNAVAVTFVQIAAPWAQWIIPVCVSLAAFGSLNACLFINSRMIMTASKNGHLPTIFGLIHHKHHTPIPAIVFNGLLVIAMSLIKDVFALINCLSFALWTITGVSISGLLVLRWKFPIATRPVKVALFVPVVFATCCLFLILVPAVKIPMQSGIGLVITALGIPLYYSVHLSRKSAVLARFAATFNCLTVAVFNAGPDDSTSNEK